MPIKTLCNRHEDKRIKAADELREAVSLFFKHLRNICIDKKLLDNRLLLLQENCQKRTLFALQTTLIKDFSNGHTAMTIMRN